MQFIYDEKAGLDVLKVEGDNYKYLFKARRHKIEDTITFRNLKDNSLYTYEVSTISKKEALLRLLKKEEKIVESNRKLHILWSLIDPKSIEKELPHLNEMGVNQISFVYAKYSQKNFKLNFDKMNKILINSSQQCGRSSIIKLDMIDSLDNFLKQYPNTHMLHFSSQMIDEVNDIEIIFIGCEGGFSLDEVKKFDDKKIVGLNSNLILRSETAASAVASKILL